MILVCRKVLPGRKRPGKFSPVWPSTFWKTLAEKLCANSREIEELDTI